MKKIKRKYIVIVIILIALFGVVFTKALTRQVDVAYCESNNILIHPPLTFTSDYILRFHEGIGSMNMHGIADVSGKKYIISRVIHFTYVRNGHTYFLTNTNTHSLDKEEVHASGIDNHFPGFFKKIKIQCFLLMVPLGFIVTNLCSNIYYWFRFLVSETKISSLLSYSVYTIVWYKPESPRV